MKTETKMINGKKVTIILLGARDGIRISMKIPFKELVEACFEKVDELDIDAMAETLFQGATVNDFPLKIDSYFQANYGEFIDFLAFALEANFGSFFEASIFKSLTSQQEA